MHNDRCFSCQAPATQRRGRAVIVLEPLASCLVGKLPTRQPLPLAVFCLVFHLANSSSNFLGFKRDLGVISSLLPGWGGIALLPKIKICP